MDPPSESSKGHLSEAKKAALEKAREKAREKQREVAKNRRREDIKEEVDQAVLELKNTIAEQFKQPVHNFLENLQYSSSSESEDESESEPEVVVKKPRKAFEQRRSSPPPKARSERDRSPQRTVSTAQAPKKTFTLQPQKFGTKWK